MNLFQFPHIIGIIPCLSFCDWLILRNISSSRFAHVKACVSFLPFSGRMASHVWIGHILSQWTLGLLCLLAVVNTAAMNMSVHIPLWDFSFRSFGCVPRSRIAGSCGDYILIFNPHPRMCVCLYRLPPVSAPTRDWPHNLFRFIGQHANRGAQPGLCFSFSQELFPMVIPFHIPTNHVQRFQFVSQKLFHAIQQLHEECVAPLYIWRHWSLRRLNNWLVQSYPVTVPSLHLGPIRLSSSLPTLLYHLYYPPLRYMVGVLPLEQLWWNVGNYSL